MPRIEVSWKTSYLFVVLVAFSIGVSTVAISMGVDWLMHDQGLIEAWVVHQHLRAVYASDVLSGLAASTVSGIAIGRIQRRRRELLRRMQAVEDVNHHVRNALTAVSLSAALHDDPELNDRVRDAVERIDWVLRDVLPNTVKIADVVAVNSRWSRGRRLADRDSAM